VSRERRKAAALKDCRCFEEVERRLRLGWTGKEIVKFIQEEQEELTDLSPKYVKKMVDEYRQSIPPGELALTSQNHQIVRHANRRMANGLNELDELEKLYKKQYRRIKIDFGNEKRINKLLPNTGREIYYAMRILKESADLKMELGIAKRQLGEVSVTGEGAVQISNRYNDGVGKVMADPDSRRKVISLVTLLTNMSDKGVIDSESFAQDSSEIIDVASEEATNSETEE